MVEMREGMASLPVPDDLLAEIFLRLPTPTDLVRASAACVSFRRVAAARSFVRRFRKLHAPPLLGFLDGNQKFHAAIPPHPSAPAASAAAALVADFSFLPAPVRDWVVLDSRDGRILLDNANTDEADFRETHEAVFADMVVCDPLHRRYVPLPPIPHDLADSVEDPPPLQPRYWREAFLLPPCDDEVEEEETSFRVIWMAQCKAKLCAFIFSSSTRQWRASSSTRWKDLFPVPRLLPSKEPLFLYRQYSYGCFYWSWRTKYGHYGTTLNNMLVLDTKRMEFSIAEPPTQAKSSADGFDIAMVEAGESRPGLFTYTAGVLGYCIRQNDSESLSQYWKKDSRTISLGPGYSLVGSTGRYLLLYKFRSSLQASGFYTLDIKTFQLEKVCHAMKYSFWNIRAYINFPPSFLSLPTISSGSRSSGGKVAPPRMPPPPPPPPCGSGCGHGFELGGRVCSSNDGGGDADVDEEDEDEGAAGFPAAGGHEGD